MSIESLDTFRQKSLNQQAANGGPVGDIEWGMRLYKVIGSKASGIKPTIDEEDDDFDYEAI